MTRRTASRPVLSPCIVHGPDMLPVLPQAVTQCRTCGAVMRPVPMTARMDDWVWVDIAGQTEVDDAPALYREDPAEWWRQCAKHNIGLYSTLSAQLRLGGRAPWVHIHEPRSVPVGRSAWHLIPFCHGMPMHEQPRGWVCRVAGTVFPF